MHSRFCRIALSALTAVTLSGCVQMTRHSNTLVFGTNTSFGVKVGADATSTPGINVGYSRQEAVIIPVVANTADNGTVQAPCPQIVAPGTVKADLPDNCRLIANAGSDTDTLSVLANFGSKYAANGGTAPSVNGEISQYFATGLAARILAEKAGASAIATGPAAAASYEAEAERLIGDKGDLASIVAGKVGALATDLTAFLIKLDAGAQSGKRFQQACAGLDKDGCAANIKSRQGLMLLSVVQWTKAGAVNP